MLKSIERLSGEPILILSFDDTITGDEMRVAWGQCLELIQDVFEADPDSTIYRITDLSQVNLTFPQLITVMAAAVAERNTPGSALDPRFFEIAVLKPGGLVAFGAKSMSQRQYGSLQVESFESLEAAIQFARSQVQ